MDEIFYLPTCPKLTRVLVTEVPMFAPMIMGIAVRTSKTEININ